MIMPYFTLRKYGFKVYTMSMGGVNVRSITQKKFTTVKTNNIKVGGVAL